MERIKSILLNEQARAVIKFLFLNSQLRKFAIYYVGRQMAKGFDRPDGFQPPKAVMEDKLDMTIAMLTAIDRGLKQGLISKQYWYKMIDTFMCMFVRGHDKVVRFREKYGIEPPGFITISPTHFCNLTCEGCYSASSSAQRERLPYYVFSRIIREQKDEWGSHFTVISGGEPFIYRDSGKDLLDIFAEHQDTYFQIFTNGTMINKKVAQRLAEVGNATPAISVEGFEAETDARRGKGVYRKILKAMEELRKAQVPFGISVTSTKKNIHLLLTDEFWDFWFDEQGALYAWLFQYMPIGRAFTLELMISPEERLESFKMTWKQIREKRRFIADFWNCGTVSNGCISAGVRGGYMHIDWNGNVCPCVFIPYYLDNINEIYQRGGSLTDVLFSPLFIGIRKWQREYVYDRPPEQMGNVIATCPYRDHYHFIHELLRSVGAKPQDEAAKIALSDSDYIKGMIDYGRKFEQVTQKIWESKYLCSCSRMNEQAESKCEDRLISASEGLHTKTSLSISHDSPDNLETVKGRAQKDPIRETKTKRSMISRRSGLKIYPIIRRILVHK